MCCISGSAHAWSNRNRVGLPVGKLNLWRGFIPLLSSFIVNHLHTAYQTFARCVRAMCIEVFTGMRASYKSYFAEDGRPSWTYSIGHIYYWRISLLIIVCIFFSYLAHYLLAVWPRISIVQSTSRWRKSTFCLWLVAGSLDQFTFVNTITRINYTCTSI
jgi:hypothetical protein